MSPLAQGCATIPRIPWQLACLGDPSVFVVFLEETFAMAKIKVSDCEIHEALLTHQGE